MICPKCSGATSVVNSRPHKDDATVIQRRRHCEACGHRWNTFEGTYNIVLKRQIDRRCQANNYAALSPERKKAKNKRARVLRAAKVEAAETGKPLAEILQAWGLAA